jgi:hypothetical protein
MRTADLTLAEARDAIRALEASVSTKCDTHASIERNGSSLLSLSIYPKGIARGGETIWVKADTWRDLIAKGEAAWAERSDLHAANTTRDMALAIIRITADQGECTDAALRAEFDAVDVARFGERACERATEMAANGPFSIVKLSGANDAEAA